MSTRTRSAIMAGALAAVSLTSCVENPVHEREVIVRTVTETVYVEDEGARAAGYAEGYDDGWHAGYDEGQEADEIIAVNPWAEADPDEIIVTNRWADE